MRADVEQVVRRDPARQQMHRRLEIFRPRRADDQPRLRDRVLRGARRRRQRGRRGARNHATDGVEERAPVHAGQFLTATTRSRSTNANCYTSRMAARWRRLVLPLALLGPVAAAQAPTPPAAPARHVDRDLLMSDVGTLGAAAFEGRSTGTPGGLRARQWIVEQFRNVGLQPAQTGGYLQP